MSASYAEKIAEVQPPFARARAHCAEVESTLSGAGMMAASHADLESFANKAAREWARLLLEEHMAMRAALERVVPVVDADGVRRESVRSSERHLETVVGTVAVPRKAYQAPGREDRHPMDAALNLPVELFSHGVREMVAKEIARASFEEVIELVRDYSGAQIAKRQAEELVVRAATDFDAFYAQRQREADAAGDLLVISTDGKGIVVRHQDLREGTRLAAEQSAHKLETRLTPGEKHNRKRMAQVATVYTVAPWVRTAADVVHPLRDKAVEATRPAPRNKRVWASVEKHPRRVIREAFEDALRRDPQRHRRWVVLVDGEPKQLRAVKAEARRVGVEVTILVDVVHVLEYIWKAARALFGESCSEAEEWVGYRLFALLTGSSGGELARTIRWWAKKRASSLDDSARKAIAKACGYLADRTRTRLMHYEEALSDGLPIATGVVEGACRYLVKDRMDRTGARWSLAGADAVLRLRALRASGDFDNYWALHLAREKERNHDALYAAGAAPNPLPARKRHIRLVK
jgi:hypothetical protein